MSMEHREMNLFDFCKAIIVGIGNIVKWLLRGFGEMIRLTYRQWWVVMVVVLVVVALALYYARPSNRMYEANAVAILNGVTNEMVANEFEALGKVNKHFAEQNIENMLELDAELAWRISHFEAFDVIDLLADSTVDMVDYRHKVSRIDTLCVHMPNMVALRFRTKEPNRLKEVENAILGYLNSRPYFQMLFADYRAQAEREAEFHIHQVEKLDSLTSAFYFSHNSQAQMQMDAWESGMVLGMRGVELFLEDVYKEMRVREYAGARRAVCAAPVVLQSHFILEPKAVNGPLRMSALGIVVGWLVGLIIAVLVDKRKRIQAWLRE